MAYSTSGYPAGRHELVVVVTSSTSDSHTWNLLFLQLLLQELGHAVVNLGACVPAELLIEECRRHRPDLVVVSSVNGHGHRDGMTTIGAFRSDPELAGTTIIIGGKLRTSDAPDVRYANELMGAGFNAVFTDADLDSFRLFVETLSLRPADRADRVCHAAR